jgi:hypothetical protein
MPTKGVTRPINSAMVQVNIFGKVTRWRTPGHRDPEQAKKGLTAERCCAAFT